MELIQDRAPIAWLRSRFCVFGVCLIDFRALLQGQGHWSNSDIVYLKFFIGVGVSGSYGRLWCNQVYFTNERIPRRVRLSPNKGGSVPEKQNSHKRFKYVLQVFLCLLCLFPQDSFAKPMNKTETWQGISDWHTLRKDEELCS